MFKLKGLRFILNFSRLRKKSVKKFKISRIKINSLNSKSSRPIPDSLARSTKKRARGDLGLGFSPYWRRKWAHPFVSESNCEPQRPYLKAHAVQAIRRAPGSTFSPICCFGCGKYLGKEKKLKFEYYVVWERAWQRHKREDIRVVYILISMEAHSLV